MSDQLSTTHLRAAAPRVRVGRRELLQGLLVVVAFVAAGALGGLVWHAVWDAPRGVVADHRWYPQPWDPGQQALFAATGWYSLIAAVAGLVLGAIAAWFLTRSEVVTVLSLAIGSVAASIVMKAVGQAMGPADPEALARTAKDGTHLSGHLSVSGYPPLLLWPVAALCAATVVYLLLSPQRETREE